METTSPHTESLDPHTNQLQPHAPYGKACLNCVKSKTRCATSTSLGRCDRCCRLDKICQPGPTVRKKRVAKRPASSTSSKTAALEEKLDGIVQMLQRSQVATPAVISVQEPRQSQISDSRAYNERILDSGRTSDADDPFPLTPASITGNSIASDRLNCTLNYPVESDAELEDYLETYRTKMVPYFPTVCIGGDVTVESLRNERPFLFLVIRTICNRNLRRQAALVTQIKKVLAREMLFEATRSIDLFLGIIVFASWCHYYICHKPILSTIIQLAISLASDLGLMRPLASEHQNHITQFIAKGTARPMYNPPTTRTMEERRAVLGLFLFSSIAASTFQRVDPIRWTPYFDECLRLLEEEKEYPTDELFVYLVRIQLICNKGSALTWNAVYVTRVIVPAELYSKTLKSQLDILENSVPLDLKSNATLQLHFLSATVIITEHNLNATPKSVSSDPVAQLQRIEGLWTCLTAVKSWFNTWFSDEEFQMMYYPHISMSLLSQMAHCVIALFRLSFFESADIPWDCRRVRQELDLGEVIKIMAERWDQVPIAIGIDVSHRAMGEDDPWSITMKKLTAIGKCWEMKLAAKRAADATADAERESGLGAEADGIISGLEVPGQQQTEGLDFGGMNMEMMLDDAWMRDLFGVGNEPNFGVYF